GLVTIEAMLSELPVVIHNGPVFQWLAQGTPSRLINMTVRGSLLKALGEVFAKIGSLEMHAALQQARGVARQRFSWEVLLPLYLEMYRKCNENIEAGIRAPSDGAVGSVLP